jgi:hypothetical protein
MRCCSSDSASSSLPAARPIPNRCRARWRRARALRGKPAACCCPPRSTPATPGRKARPLAWLQLRLPRDAVEPFVEALLRPLPGKATVDAVLRSRSATADDLTASIADTERRRMQLIDYRERLTALAARPDAKLDELIKVVLRLLRPLLGWRRKPSAASSAQL